MTVSLPHSSIFATKGRWENLGTLIVIERTDNARPDNAININMSHTFSLVSIIYHGFHLYTFLSENGQSG